MQLRYYDVLCTDRIERTAYTCNLMAWHVIDESSSSSRRKKAQGQIVKQRLWIKAILNSCHGWNTHALHNNFSISKRERHIYCTLARKYYPKNQCLRLLYIIHLLFVSARKTLLRICDSRHQFSRKSYKTNDRRSSVYSPITNSFRSYAQIICPVSFHVPHSRSVFVFQLHVFLVVQRL